MLLARSELLNSRVFFLQNSIYYNLFLMHYKSPPPIFCPHAFNFGATFLCVEDFYQKIV